MVEGDESSQLGIAHKPAVLAGYLLVKNRLPARRVGLEGCIIISTNRKCENVLLFRNLCQFVFKSVENITVL